MLKATIKKWQDGTDAFAAGKFKEAQACFQAIDDMSKILYDLGVVHFKQANYNEAITAFSRSVKCDPFLAVAYFMKGAACQLKNDISSAITHYDEAIRALRGHEFIDYKQLGMDYKLLFCEVLVNKAMCLNKSGQQAAVAPLMREAIACKVIRDDSTRYRWDDMCNGISSGTMPKEPYTVPLELLFLPPRIKADTKPPAGPGASAGAASASGSNSKASAPASRADAEPARPALPTRPVSSGAGAKSLPAVPAKKLPPRPVSLRGEQSLLTIKCFYKDRRLIQISSFGTFDDLQEKIYAKFEVLDLLVKYKTSAGDVRPIRNTSDLSKAVADSLQEIYLALPGETNEFEPKAATSLAPSLPSRAASPSSAPALPSRTASPSPSSAPALPARTASPTPSSVAPAVPSKSTAKAAVSLAPTPLPKPASKAPVSPSASPSFASKTNIFQNGASKASTSQNGNSKPSTFQNGKPANGAAKKKSVWQECYTEDGEKYFFNTETQETSWDPNIDPSPPWTVCYSDAGDKYYYNPDTDASTWEFPG